ncbi:hypothetical protein JIN85_09520 [Luteolibacter pohnpeiensis]|uniref:Uncharacterized protein n=1 Tax=Luteolibacter pohnpeiensis TaxID=454153 RepID=A0A934S3T4_9BACT|nr:hypothetical protein [Luteolibacter pohnpeiensis]MBK1882655.1 hypothetical protein [Luteolibacter pohnpeiensis]
MIYLAEPFRRAYIGCVLALPRRSPPPLKKPLQLLFAIFACLHLAGGPYSIAQTYAWINMLISYSQNDGIVKATVDTFSGNKPCAICCKIQETRKSERNKDERSTPPGSTSAKLLQELLPTKNTTLPVPASCDISPSAFPGVSLPHGLLSDAPPVPPPCRIG